MLKVSVSLSPQSLGKVNCFPQPETEESEAQGLIFKDGEKAAVAFGEELVCVQLLKLQSVNTIRDLRRIHCSRRCNLNGLCISENHRDSSTT